MGRLAWLVPVAAWAACGSPSALPGDARSLDGGLLVEGPNVVTVRLYGAADYIRYRNGTSGWGEPERVSDREYRLHVDDPYQVIVVCVEDFEGFIVAESELHGRALADGDDLFFGCGPYDAPPPTVPVSGQMLQAGEVSFGDFAYSTSAPWSFALDVAPGVHDLIALDTSDRIAIRRDLTVTSASTLPTIDLDQEGTALLAQPFTLFGVGDGETVTSWSAVYTAHEYAIMTGTSTHLLVAPSSLLVAGDRQTMSITAELNETSRSVSGPIGSQTGFTLMPAIAKNALTFSVPDNRTLRGDVTSLPAFDELELAIYGLSTQRAAVTKAFLAASQRDHIAFDTPLDFDRRWRVDLRQEYSRTIRVTRRAEPLTHHSYRFDHVTNVLGN